MQLLTCHRMWAVLLSLATSGCAGVAAVAGADEPTTVTREDVDFFESRVRPLLVARCARCHGVEKQQGHLRLDSRAAMLAGGETGPAAQPGNPKASLLVRAIRYEGPEMPPDGKLTEKEIDLLTSWIARGAPWPGRADSPATVGAAQGAITNDDRAHWSFQPIRVPKLPAIAADHASHRQAIDAFIAAPLAEKRFHLSPSATPRELHRRASFDLLGLPPSFESVVEFEADTRPDAWERSIDRLLSQPQYGERWGRHWLDVVRFGQTNGYERDDEKPNAWRYRDYVIRALNQDKPYDRFTLEQLAGDELPDLTQDSLIATGFYRVGVWDDEPDDKLAAVWDETDDMLRTVGETFLGLTIGCARCHDHKFDPIPHEDYYRMAALLRGILPYGRDKDGSSATHWELNPDAIFTPLATAEQIAAWSGESAALRARLAGKQRELQLLRLDAATPESRRKELQDEVRKLRQALERPPFDQALSVREAGPRPEPTHVLVRGSILARGKEVGPGFLSVLTGPSSGVPSFVSPPPALDASTPLVGLLRESRVQPTSGRRLALARWITGADHPLAARVMANRLWHYHFGRGIVPTPNDLGRQALAPTHPELLDWLATELRRGDWELKRMHRLIMTSATYRQSSRLSADHTTAMNVDPGNLLLWRQNPRRLEAEAIRDAMLAANGTLDLTLEGRGIFPELPAEVLATQSRPGLGWDKSDAASRLRRSVYIFSKRTLGVPFLETFDQPNPDRAAPARGTTTVAPQALVLLNSQFMDESAAAFANRLARAAAPGERVRLAFRLALARDPTEQELAIAERFLARQREQYIAQGAATSSGPATAGPATSGTNNVGSAAEADEFAFARLARLVFNLNEFVYVD